MIKFKSSDRTWKSAERELISALIKLRSKLEHVLSTTK